MKIKHAFVLLLLAVIPSLLSDLFAAPNTYNFRIISGNTTGIVETLQITNAAGVTLTITNLPGGERRALLGILGTGGTNSPGGSATPTIVSNGLIAVTVDGTNIVYVDTVFLATNGAPFSAWSGTLPVSALPSGSPTNLQTSTGTFSYDAASRTYTLNLPAFGTGNGNVSTASNQTYSANTTQQMDVVTANVGTFTRGAIAGWNTNKSGFAIMVLRGSDGSDTYNMDGTRVVMVSSNNTLSGTNTFTGPVFLKGSVIVSNDVTLAGTLNAATLNGVLNGTNLTGNGTIGTNLLQATGANPSSYGSSSQVATFTLNDRGQVVNAGNVAIANGNAIATNAISLVVGNGTSNSPLVTLIFSNLDVHVVGANTSTVGFASMPFYTINAGTNFAMHGPTLTITNVNTQGLSISGSGSSTLTFGGFVSNLTAVGGGYIAISSNNSNTVQVNTSPGFANLIIGGGLVASSSSAQINVGTSGQAFTVVPTTLAGNGLEVKASSGQNQAGYAALDFNGFSTYGSIWNDMNALTRALYIDLGTFSGAGLIVVRPGQLVGSREQFGSNTNFPRIVFSDAVSPSNPTNAAQNSNWTAFGTAIPARLGFISIASNMTGIAFWRSTRVSTNNTSTGLSTSATDDSEFRTNNCAVIANPASSAALSNVWVLGLRNESNGQPYVWNSTNAPSHLQIVATNSFTNGVQSVYSFPNQLLAANAASLTIWNLNFADTNYVARISPSYATTTFWSSKTTTSITINVATVDPASQQSLDVELQHQ